MKGITLIMPTSEGKGVDTFAATLSAGPAIKTVVVGLLDDVSLESTQRLARSTYTRVVETIGLNDTRKPEEQIDSLVRLRPDLILIAGGTDGGAARSVQRLMETVGLACYLLPADKRPALLFAGNQNLADEVQEKFAAAYILFKHQPQPASRNRYRGPPTCPACPDRTLHPGASQSDESVG